MNEDIHDRTMRGLSGENDSEMSTISPRRSTGLDHDEDMDEIIQEDLSYRIATPTSVNQPILKSKDSALPPNPYETRLCINMYPSQYLGLVIEGSDDDSLSNLMKYAEGSNFDLHGISHFLSTPDLDPNLQCAALQLLEHAAEWQSTNFADCVSVTIGPVVKLVLDSRDSDVHCATLDTLKLFLSYSDATGIIKAKMSSSVVDAVSRDLISLDPWVQLASVEFLDAAFRSNEVLIEFAAAIPHISGAIHFMPTATKVAALTVLEICAGSDTYQLVKAVADTLHHLDEPLSSIETDIRIAAQKVLEVGAMTRDNLRHIFNLKRARRNFQSSGRTDIRSTWGTVIDKQASRSIGEESDMDVDSSDKKATDLADDILSSRLKRHSQTNIPSLGDTFMCSWIDAQGLSCNEPFHGEDLSTHMREVHNIRGADNLHIICQWRNCGLELNKECLSRHLEEKHLSIVNCCDTCGKTFSRRDTLKKHTCRSSESDLPALYNDSPILGERPVSRSFSYPLDNALTRCRAPLIVRGEVSRCIQQKRGYERPNWPAVLRECGIAEKDIPSLLREMAREAGFPFSRE